jgi:hypothetical protein
MSTQPFTAENFNDAEGRPAGGFVGGVGLRIDWQNGPLGRTGSNERVAPNGAFVETVLEAVKQRIDYYQTAFPCRENALAITKIEEALHWLNARTTRRVNQGVEGTHEGS